MKNLTSLSDVLKDKRNRLRKITGSRSKGFEVYGSQPNRRTKAKNYLEELEELLTLIDASKDVRLVSLQVFKRRVESADVATIELDGKYCKFALLQNYPYDDIWVLFLATIESDGSV